jgi:uncharacterized protein
MNTLDRAVTEFLGRRRIAVAGASRKGDTAANVIYRRMRKDGYQVFAVNPNADEIEGDVAWPDLGSIPGGVDAVVVGTSPSASLDVVRQAAANGIDLLWFHRSFGTGSIGDEAVELARQLGLRTIVGGCPMMHLQSVDPAHRCFRWWLEFSGRAARPEGFENTPETMP